MKPAQWLTGILLLLLLSADGWARTYTEAEGRAAWARLQRQALTETTFRQACDLIQDIGQTNINLAYELLAEYVPNVRKIHNRQWTHVLLMNWAKAKASLHVPQEAERLYQQARQNADTGSRLFREALTGTIILYAEWGKADSLAKYLTMDERASRAANDAENLSFVYTFRAMSRIRQAPTDTLRREIQTAIRLAETLPDKNALFTARFNYAVWLCQDNLQRQVAELEGLLNLAKHPSLARKPRLYERTNFVFRNPAANAYYYLAQVNLLLTDYDNADKFIELFYDATVRPNPAHPQAPYLNAEMAIVKAYRGDYKRARALLDSSRRQFKLPEADITYTSYFVAAGLLAEQQRQFGRALRYYAMAQQEGTTTGIFLMPTELYYAHGLIQTKRYNEARRAMNPLKSLLSTRTYSAIGLYYYRYLADLYKAQGDYPRYASALDTHYAIRDSLTNLNHYRSIQQALARIRFRDKEQQISRLNAQNAARTEQLRRERLFYGIILTLAALTIGLLLLFVRNRQAHARQQAALQQSRLEQLEQQQRIDHLRDVMEAEENERRKLADQLHNDVNPLLALATLNVSSVLEMDGADGVSEQKLRKTQQVLTAASATVRGISHRLMPLITEHYGFRQAIIDLTETVNLAGRLHVEPILVGFGDSPAIALSFLNDLYRIIQELVHNILKHANATYATVEVIEFDDHVTIVVDDNGVGIADEVAGNGQGLKAIRSKVLLHQGRLDIQHKRDGGTLIVIDNLALPHRTDPV